MTYYIDLEALTNGPGIYNYFSNWKAKFFNSILNHNIYSVPLRFWAGHTLQKYTIKLYFISLWEFVVFHYKKLNKKALILYFHVTM